MIEETTPEKPKTERIPLTIRIDLSIYGRIRSYKKKNGICKDQDVIRIAIAKFLDAEGF